MSEGTTENNGVDTTGRRQYWCFISYRHADNKEPGRQWASWLHHCLETYEVPPDLVGKRNSRGDVIPERIYPVFRDEEELPADAHLSKPIEGALANSRFLVVLCSPRARSSRFVNEEILHFKRLAPANRDRVLAAIIAGDPAAPDSPDEDRPYALRQCFPEPLRIEVDSEGTIVETGVEPIAPDFRLEDGSEGFANSAALRESLRAGGLDRSAVASQVTAYEKRKELMTLKIVAGVLGIDLGQLTQRNKAHQLRKARARARLLTILSGIFALLALFAGWMSVVAVRRSDDADRERLRAEAREKEALRQQANALMTQGVRMLAQQEVRGVCHLVESLKVSPDDNPALAALLTTLHFRRWPWPVAEVPPFEEVEYITGSRSAELDDEGTLSFAGGNPEADKALVWQLPGAGTRSPRYGARSGDLEPSSEAPVDVVNTEDVGVWSLVRVLDSEHVVRINRATRQWAVWDTSEESPGITLGPATYTGDLDPVFAYNEPHDLLAVCSLKTSGRGEYTTYSSSIHPEIFSLEDCRAPGWNSGEDIPHEPREPISSAVRAQLHDLLELDDLQYGERVQFLPSPDGQWIAGGGVGQVWICDAAPLSMQHHFNLERAYSPNGVELHWSPNSRYLMVYAYEESLWYTPAIIDLKAVGKPTLLEAIRVYYEPRFSSDSHWALCLTDESVELFDLPTRGNTCHFRIPAIRPRADEETTVYAQRLTDTLLQERRAPPWLGELALSLAGWRLDESGGLVQLDHRRQRLEEALAAVHAAADSPLKEWALEWLTRFDGPIPIRRVVASGGGLTDEEAAALIRNTNLRVGDEFTAARIDQALRDAYTKGSYETLQISAAKIWGGVVVELSATKSSGDR